MNQVTVVDVDDPALDDYRRLSEPRYRRRIETETSPGFLIAEGPEVVRRLATSGLRLRSVLATPAMRQRLADLLRPLDCPVFVADRPDLARIVGFDLHRGIVAAADRPTPTTVAAIARLDGPLAVLEGINDHENLGAILRSAAALGIAGVVLDPTSCDPFYRRSVRVSMGAALVMPIARAGAWPEDLELIRASGRTLVAMALAPGAVTLDRLTATAPAAVMCGAEGPGLTRAALDRADLVVTIPMSGGMDSLNVAHAAAIAFHHLRPS